MEVNWAVIHDDIGFIKGFELHDDAVDYCKKENESCGEYKHTVCEVRRIKE